MGNFQVLTYYLKHTPPVDEDGTPYQGKIIKIDLYDRGQMPMEFVVQSRSPDASETAILSYVTLN